MSSDIPLSLAITAISFLLTVIWGDPFIRALRHYGIGKKINPDMPIEHRSKENTPTMGGIMFLIPITLLSILLNAVNLFGSRLFGASILVPLFAMLSFAAMGAIDDWEGIRGPRKSLGMSKRTKMIIQIILSLIIAYFLKDHLLVPQLYWPASSTSINFGWLYLPIASFVIISMANAVNFTDGLDGLATLISMVAFGIYGIIALMQEQIYLARFCFCIVGALAGFLWFNVHPASLIMGDTGSQALGASLAVVALMTGRWLLLPLIAIIPTAEMLSVVIQILYFRVTHGKRFFAMAPLHLHFQKRLPANTQWQENQIVLRFFLVELIGALFGLALIFMG